MASNIILVMSNLVESLLGDDTVLSPESFGSDFTLFDFFFKLRTLATLPFNALNQILPTPRIFMPEL